MNSHYIETQQDFEDLKAYVKQNGYQTGSLVDNALQFEDHEKFILNLAKAQQWAQQFDNSLIRGKDNTENIVSIEVSDNSIELFIEKNGIVSSKFVPYQHWLISPIKPRVNSASWYTLKSDLHYKYLKYYDSKKDLLIDRNKLSSIDPYVINDAKEAAMVMHGFTYYKNMKVSDVSVLFFDIEATGLIHNENSRVLMISNTLRKNGRTTKRIFSCDNYPSDADMLLDWCSWIREENPSVICGFNIFGYDLPYINFCAGQCGVSLALGRDGSNIVFSKHDSKFRKDGSQDYLYKRCYIYGREIVDMMFVAYHSDISRKYEKYRLKDIIEQEGLEKPGRQHYDAAKIAQDWPDPEKREKIKAYGQDDSDDVASLWDLMISPYFYFAQFVPKSFQVINYSASGSQLNAFLVRSYLQHGYSIPQASNAERVKGAISFGVPGIYSNVLKIDLKALYPNIIRSFGIYPKYKDPKQHFLKITNYFTNYRLEMKDKYQETKDRYYYDMEQAIKIFINSLYGLMNTNGLNFNYPDGAALVTKIGREILTFSIKWATNKDLDYWIKLFKEKTGQELEEEVVGEESDS